MDDAAQAAGTIEAGNAMRRALEHLPQGVAVFDRDLRLITANARYEELLVLPPSLIAPGTPLSALTRFSAERGDFGPGDPETLIAQRLRELGEPATVSRRRGGDGQVLEFHSQQLPDGGLVVSFSDVTARVTAEAALERMNLSLEARVVERTAALTRVNAELEQARSKADAANRDKTRFLAAASHDLLQPLNAARLYTASLLERATGSEFVDLAQAIEASLNAVEDIMSALLDISRIDSGVIKPAPTTFAIADVLRKVDVEFGPLAQERAIRLTVSPSSLAVVADRALLARIVQNLVSNAIKYTRAGGRVLVGCRRHGNRLRLDVIDTGIGFNRDQQGLIFAEFSRLEQGARMAQGLGLGLSIVRRLVTTLGLTLELDSVEGEGSRFSLLLPLARERPSGETRDTGRETPHDLTGIRVLCVDNEKPVIDAMNGLLSGWGCDVRSARSLREIDREGLLIGWLPDIVLMDYHLDQTSGLDAIEWLRHNVGGHLPAALLTADRSPEVRRLAEERAIAVITKPVKPAALRATISGLSGALRQAGARPLESSVSN